MRKLASHPRAGETVVWRDVFRGRIVCARPMRVVTASDDLIVCSLSAGTPVKVHSTYKSGRRKQYIEDLATGDWTLQDATWHSTNMLMFSPANAWYAACMFFDAERGQFLHYYANFQRPRYRTSIGFDTFDLCLDIMIPPGGEWRWKDEDEFARAVELGLLSSDEERSVRAAGEEVIGMIEARRAPFDGGYVNWRAPAALLTAFPVGWQELDASPTIDRGV
jgi:predicted RNA-binding protein associated with RNAse of E/G family